MPPIQAWVHPRHPNLLPDSPAWDAHGLDDADDQLGHEGKEECHEAEGAVSPAAEEMILINWVEGQGFPYLQDPPGLSSLNDYTMDRRRLQDLVERQKRDHVYMDLRKLLCVSLVCATLHRERSPYKWTSQMHSKYMEGWPYWHRNRWVSYGRNK